MKRRVFLRKFDFNYYTLPLLLNVWEKNGIDKEFEIKVLERISDIKKINKDDVFIYSFMTPHIPVIAEEISFLKEYNVLIAAGGPHITGEKELSRRIGIDVLFLGEGEKSFYEFGVDLINGKIKDFYFSSGNVKLDDYIPVSKYFDYIPKIEIMRGCFWRCKYCETGILKPKFRSIESIGDYFYELKKRGYKRIGFITPSSSEYMAEKGRKVNLEAIEELLSFSKNSNFDFIEYGIFPSEVRPDTLSEDFLRIIKNYCTNRKLTIGAQSGVNERLKGLKRGHTIEEVERAVSLANDYGFLVYLDFIFAYPDEKEEEFKESVEFIKKIVKNYRVKIHLHHFFPLSGSEYQWRKPSFLSKGRREALIKMSEQGFSTDWWIESEKRVYEYFTFLKRNYPDFYKRYE